MKSVLLIKNLEKRFGKKKVLSNISLEIKEGKVVGLLGKNGSGKTTLLKACMGLLRPSAGHINILGKNPWKDRTKLCEQVCFIPDTATLDGWMKIKDLLSFIQNVHPNWNRDKANKLFTQSDLSMDMKIRTLSKGMQIKLYLLMVISIDSKVMILDEPTLGLDISFRKYFFDTLMRDCFDEQRTVIISSHIVEEVESILEEIIFIDNGQVILKENVEQLKNRFTTALLSNAQALLIEESKKYMVGSFMDQKVYLISKEALSILMKDNQKIETKSPKLADIFLGFVEGDLR